MTLFKNKYRIESARLKDHDYSSAGDYYVTIDTRDRSKILGNINSGKMVLNDAGKIAADTWKNLPVSFTNIRLGDFIIMPEHMHGIISIFKEGGKSLFDAVGAFKSISSKQIGILLKMKWGNVWQKGFYDRLIRGEFEYFFVSEYIKNNPLKTDPEYYYKEWYEMQEIREKYDKNTKNDINP